MNKRFTSKDDREDIDAAKKKILDRMKSKPGISVKDAADEVTKEMGSDIFFSLARLELETEA